MPFVPLISDFHFLLNLSKSARKAKPSSCASKLIYFVSFQSVSTVAEGLRSISADFFLDLHNSPVGKVNIICQLDWATGCPEIWSNIILGVSVRVFLDEINI